MSIDTTPGHGVSEGDYLDSVKVQFTTADPGSTEVGDITFAEDLVDEGGEGNASLFYVKREGSDEPWGESWEAAEGDVPQVALTVRGWRAGTDANAGSPRPYGDQRVVIAVAVPE